MLQRLFPLLLLLPLCACTDSDPSTDRDEAESTASYVASPDQDTASYVPLYLHDIPAPDVINAATTPYGGYGQILLPPLDKPTTQLLLTGYWVIEFYIDNRASRQQRLAGTGQWLLFQPDGTFTGGHWDRQTHAGAWYLNYNTQYPTLTLDSNVDQLDAVWEMQRIAADKENMGWRRFYDVDFGPRRGSIILKLNRLDNMPTKEQYAHQLKGL